VSTSDDRDAARDFVNRLLSDEGRAALRRAGFALP
jgi:ABC-type molybdate transport system substrate-binding protein